VLVLRNLADADDGDLLSGHAQFSSFGAGN
jgi:hypothetical protein